MFASFDKLGIFNKISALNCILWPKLIIKQNAYYCFCYIRCLTSLSSVVRALEWQPIGPGSFPGMSRLESAIVRGNLIMLLPPSYTSTQCFAVISQNVTITKYFKLSRLKYDDHSSSLFSPDLNLFRQIWLPKKSFPHTIKFMKPKFHKLV